MNPQDVWQLVLNYIPVVLTALSALGLWHVAAALIRVLTAKIRGEVAKTPSKVDDAIALPIADALDKLAGDLDQGRVSLPQGVQRLKEIQAKLPARR